MPTVDGAHLYEILTFNGGHIAGFDTRSQEELENEAVRLVTELRKAHAASHRDKFGAEDDDADEPLAVFRLNGIPSRGGEGKVSVFAAQVLGIVQSNAQEDLGVKDEASGSRLSGALIVLLVALACFLAGHFAR